MNKETMRSIEQESDFLPVRPCFQISVRGSVVLIQGLRGFSQFLQAKTVMLDLSEMRLQLLHCTLFPVNHLHVDRLRYGECRHFNRT
jgi:hypothetical protein